MPFKESSILSQREEFCRLALLPGSNVSELCRRFGIGRTAGYKWIERYRRAGTAGLCDRPRRPLTSPSRTPDAVEAQVLALRAEHPCWGGRKLRRLLEWDGVERPPSASTITEVLRRAGKLDGPRAGEARGYCRFEHPEPNDLWQMDFKGHFALDRGRCHPLTLTDDHSRYALEIGACADERTATVQERLEGLFRRYGLPRRMLADNGPPWGTTGPERYTRLTVWLLDLGVTISHGRPYHPQTQGKEERFHRTLKEELIDRRRFADLASAQQAFDGWREIYNSRRPHEGIGMETPASRYRVSARKMPDTIDPPEYDATAQVRVADEQGRIMFKRRKIRSSKAFAGKRLALHATDTDGIFTLCYRRHVLAQVDLRQNIVQPVHHVPEHLSTLSPV
ncbi:IS481 family transposase [Sphingomonas sp. RT2P30]|uniref:IS481 family transposase n=1 Tax=Parasphingomonas halimpatiens TaxID=3096162 RepID=UPI002FCB4F24